MKQDNETSYAWNAILEKLKELRQEGYTQQDIADLLGVGKGTVSRWLSKDLGSIATSFGDILRYAKRLNIPPNELTEQKFFTTPFVQHELPPPSKTHEKKSKQGFKTISLDAPEWMIEELNKKSDQIGINRQSLLRVWIAEKLDHPEFH